MNHLKSIALILAILLLLGACGTRQPAEDNTVLFYYVRSEIQYEGSDGVIAPEICASASRDKDLAFLLDLYLQGPLTDSLRSPFPDYLTVIQIREEEAYLEIVFNSRLASLTGMELTLACGCIARTCMGLSDAQEIRISANGQALDGAAYISITEDSLLLTEGSRE